jgi:RIO kinase 1
MSNSMPEPRAAGAAALDDLPGPSEREALDVLPFETIAPDQLDSDGPRPEESDPFNLPRWLTEKTRRQRAAHADERVPAHVYYPALGQFFSDGWISDVRLLVKSGKEATVYCCDATPSSGHDFIAAKVYRPVGVRHNRNPQAAYEEAALRRSFEYKVKVRTFTWDSRYREGRSIQDARLRRAFENRSRTGREVQNTTWARAEYETLQRLYAAGAAVPRPLAHAGNALLMEFCGDGDEPAPGLYAAQLPRGDAERLFWGVIENIALWLRCGVVHADLSAYNLLYWRGGVMAIDFPQAVDAAVNPHALDFLLRDVTNVCRHFGRYGLSVDPSALAYDLWDAEGDWVSPLGHAAPG